jgi:hypothetical protein
MTEMIKIRMLAMIDRELEDVKGNIIARWGGTCGRWDIS